MKQYELIGHAKRASQNTKVRFVAVGIINTLVDVGIFNFLVLLFSLSVIAASIVSTTVAMTISYMLNKRAVFRDHMPHSFKQIALFLVVTLAGIWLVQTLIMVEVLRFLEHSFNATDNSFLLWFLKNVAKGFGIIAGAVWSYVGYSRIVFPVIDHENKKK